MEHVKEGEHKQSLRVRITLELKKRKVHKQPNTGVASGLRKGNTNREDISWVKEGELKQSQ